MGTASPHGTRPRGPNDGVAPRCAVCCATRDGGAGDVGRPAPRIGGLDASFVNVGAASAFGGGGGVALERNVLSIEHVLAGALRSGGDRDAATTKRPVNGADMHAASRRADACAEAARAMLRGDVRRDAHYCRPCVER